MAYEDFVLSDSPLAYYRLDETSGTVMNDFSGNLRHGTYVADTSGDMALAQTALHLGSSYSVRFGLLTPSSTTYSYGNVPQAAWMNTDYFTTTAWVKLDVAAAGVITQHDRDGVSSEFAWRFYVNADRTLSLVFQRNGQAYQTLNSGSPLTLGATHFVASSYDGTAARIFLDGNEIATLTTAGVLFKPSSSASGFGVGNLRNTSPPQAFRGWIDGAAFFGVALTPTRIAEYCASNTSGAVPDVNSSFVKTLALDTTAKVSWGHNAPTVTSYDYRIDGGTPVNVAIAPKLLNLTGLTNAAHTIEFRPVVASPAYTGGWSAPVTFTPSSDNTYHLEVLKDNPIAYIPLDESNGPFASWPNGEQPVSLTGVRTESPITRNSVYAAGTATGVNGTVAFAPITPASTTTLTLECWVRIPATGVFNGIFAYVGGDTNGIGVGVGANSLTGDSRQFAIGRGADNWLGTNYSFPITATAQTYHIVLTLSGGVVTAYIDGISIVSSATVAYTGATNQVNVGQGYINFGGQKGLTDGIHLDSAAFYNTVLSPGRIRTHLIAGLASMDAPTLPATYPLDGGLVSIANPVRGVEFMDYSLDDGATWLPPDYPQEVLRDHPLAYYRLGEASGTTAADTSGDARPGTYSGSYSLGHTGPIPTDSNKALYTPGGGGVTTTTAAWMNVTTSFTIEAWVNPDTVSAADGNGYKNFVGRYDASLAQSATSHSWGMYSNGSQLELLLEASTGGAATILTTPVGTLQAGVWQHCVAVYDSTTARLYVNGNEVARVAYTATLAAPSLNLQIGLNGQTARNYKGYIDEVAYYDYPMDNSRINARYAAFLGHRSAPATTITGLTNGSSYTVTMRASNRYITSPTSTAAAQAPSATSPIVYLDRANREPGVGHPRHADYSMGKPTVTGSVSILNSMDGAITTNIDSGSNVYVSPAAYDVDATFLYKDGGSVNDFGFVFRYVSSTNYWMYGYEFASGGSVAALSHPVLGRVWVRNVEFSANTTLRVNAYKDTISLYENGTLLTVIGDPYYTPSGNPPAQAGARFLMRAGQPSFNQLDNFEVYSITNQDPMYDGEEAFLMKGRTTHEEDAQTYNP